MNREQRLRVGSLLLGLALIASAASVAVRVSPFAPGVAAALCFAAVVSAALLISWGAEAAQFFVSQGLAVAIIALLQVLPEFMVEAVIAWQAGRDGRVDLVFANASGSNRLLTGFGWPLIFLVTDLFHRKKHGKPLKEIQLRPENAVEVLALLLASLWYLVIIWKGKLTLVDTVVLGGGFFFYLWTLNRLPAEEEEEMVELLAPPRFLVTTSPAWRRLAYVFGIFALTAGTMWAVAHPFLESMKEVAFAVGVSQFAFVQWVAPFLTEFPEKVSAIYWARTVKLAPMALLNMVSSTVNQYTALVAMIPLAYSLSVGRPSAVLMDPMHRIEIFLSFATTLYGVACLAKLRITRRNMELMVLLFLVQFFYKGTFPVPAIDASGLHWEAIESHLAVAWGYVLLAVGELVYSRRDIKIFSALRRAREQMKMARAK